MKHVKTILPLLVVFISGLIIGLFAGQHMMHLRIRRIMKNGPQHFEETFIRRLSHELDLRPDQVSAMEPILKKTLSTMETIREKSIAEFENNLNTTLHSLHPLLDPEQQTKLNTMDARDFRPDSPPMPPPPKRPPPPPPPEKDTTQDQPDAGAAN
ncbi:MAG: hypothetical protein PHG65_07140 [Kiritimatiellae bacterium]|nr:hypothetical protein [Kiritimatiellia bacterium]